MWTPLRTVETPGMSPSLTISGRDVRRRVHRQLVVLAAGGATLVVLLGIVTTVGHRATESRERQLITATTAQRITLELDAAHERLNAAVLRAESAGSGTDAHEVREVRADASAAAAQLQKSIDALAALPLAKDEDTQREALRTTSARFTTLAQATIARALAGGPVTPADLAAIHSIHERYDDEFGDAHALLSRSADRATKANERSRTISIGVVWGTVLAAIGLTLMMFFANRRSVLGVTRRLQDLITHNENDAARGEFGRRVVEAFDMADDEESARAVVARAMGDVAPDLPMELLLADSSKAHLARVAEHGTKGAPCCPVGTPFECVAVRRGTAVTFADSEQLHACPKLRDRETGPVSAACVPITFMGRAIGVLHATGEQGTAPDAETVERLARLASHTGSRIGTLRATRQTQMQAATDSLTGLVNRRTFDHEVHELLAAGREFAIAFGDLDRFKALNDTYGHDTGDRALRLFAKVLRDTTRSEDLAARYGGEEFVVLLRDRSASEAVEAMERVRDRLRETVATADVPSFTVSFGVTDSSMGTTVTDLVRSADVALLAAKGSGRDQVVLAGTARAFVPRQPTAADEPVPATGTPGVPASVEA